MTATLHSAAHLKKAFLGAFSRTGIVLAAAEEAGVPRRNVYYWLERDERFALAFHQAEEASTQRLEREAYHRATRRRQPSDALLIFLLKARRPERYRDRYEVRHQGDPDHPERVLVEYAKDAEDVGPGYPAS